MIVRQSAIILSLTVAYVQIKNTTRTLICIMIALNVGCLIIFYTLCPIIFFAFVDRSSTNEPNSELKRWLDWSSAAWPCSSRWRLCCCARPRRRRSTRSAPAPPCRWRTGRGRSWCRRTAPLLRLHSGRRRRRQRLLLLRMVHRRQGRRVVWTANPDAP